MLKKREEKASRRTRRKLLICLRKRLKRRQFIKIRWEADTAKHLTEVICNGYGVTFAAPPTTLLS